MLPTIHIGKYIFDSYTVFTNFGTLIGLFVMYLLLQKNCKREKHSYKLVIIVFVIMAASAPFASFIKGLFRNGNGTATHFLGRVLMAVAILPIIYRFVWREKDELLQAQNCVAAYFAIQHFFNRLACWLNGCCGGKMVGKVQFPSQIVEMLGVAILLVLILISIKREKSFYYQYCICFAILIFASEFGIEETKVNVIVTAPITGVQLGALILLFISVLYMFLERKLGDCSHKR